MEYDAKERVAHLNGESPVDASGDEFGADDVCAWADRVQEANVCRPGVHKYQLTSCMENPDALCGQSMI